MPVCLETQLLIDRELRLSSIISALSYALDLTEGQPMGHAVKTCVLGMRLAESLALSPEDRADLYYALLLKDAGCSSNASRMCQIFGSDERKAKAEVKTTDWTRVSLDGLRYLYGNVAQGGTMLRRLATIAGIAVHRDRQSIELFSLRCERGANVARKIGFAERTARAIHNLDEHWDGSGYPARLKGHEIPLFAQIANLCQTVEVFASMQGRSVAFEVLRQRTGTWFNPSLVRAAQELENDETMWASLATRESAMARVKELDPGQSIVVDESRLDSICEAFGEIIDAKSPYTQRHSKGVADAAVAMATVLGLSAEETTVCRRAALLHDLGKLGVPNTILDKPSRLDAHEWDVIRMHPFNTYNILDRIPHFQEIAFIASAHHEKLDGSGYHRGIGADQLSLAARIIAVADIFDALASTRPYRKAMETEEVLRLIAKDVPHRLDAACYEALKASLA